MCQAVDGTIIGLSDSQTVEEEDKSTEAVSGGLFLCTSILLMNREAAPSLPYNIELVICIISKT